MEPDFWHERWANNQTGFHEGRANPYLVAHFAALGLASGDRVFVPLCGKTRDIGWLIAQGCRVVGAELSQIAVDQLFDDLGLTPKVTRDADLLHYAAEGIDIFVGDIFDLDARRLGPVQAVYDRAALVALPPQMRADYALHLHRITNGSPQLVICFTYDQTAMSGPPFSVDEAEVARVHGARYQITRIGGGTMPDGGLRGTIPAQEQVWLLR